MHFTQQRIKRLAATAPLAFLICHRICVAHATVISETTGDILSTFLHSTSSDTDYTAFIRNGCVSSHTFIFCYLDLNASFPLIDLNAISLSVHKKKKLGMRSSCFLATDASF